MKKLEIPLDDFAPRNTYETMLAEYDEETGNVTYRPASKFGHGSEDVFYHLSLLQPWLDAYQITDQAINILTRVRAWLTTVMPPLEDETNYEEAKQLDRMESLRHERAAV